LILSRIFSPKGSRYTANDSKDDGEKFFAVTNNRKQAGTSKLNADHGIWRRLLMRFKVCLLAVLVNMSLMVPEAFSGENEKRVPVPPGKVQLWNLGYYWQTPRVGGFSGRNAEGLRSMAFYGARNGSFSNCIVASSSEAIMGIKAIVSKLTLAKGGGSIPASAVRVRYAAAVRPDNSWNGIGRFDALLEKAPAKVAVPDFKGYSTYSVKRWKRAGGKVVATQPIWVTVTVPKDAKPGNYSGTLTVSARGLAAVRVPLSVDVAAWTLPDPRDFTVRNLARVSWDEDALFYKVPFWSKKHLELSGRTMELMNAINSQQLDIDLAEKVMHRDNAESMVLWVKKKGGGYSYDFSAVEKVFDLCAKKYGRPCPLRVNLWWYEFMTGKDFKKKGNRAGKVTTLDPATGKKGKLNEPPLGTPENIAFWRPVLTELRKRIEKRGWWGVTAVGDARYAGSGDPACVDTIHAIWPDARFNATQHGTARFFIGTDRKKVRMKVTYSETVWGQGSIAPYVKWLSGGAPAKRVVGLKPATTGIACGYARNRHHDSDPVWLHRALPEELAMRGHNGVGPLGGNLWPLPQKDGRGRLTYWNVAGKCHLGPGNSTKGLVAPGPDGAVASERYEAFREGVQLTEAMMVLVRGLNGGRLAPGLAKKVRDLLKERVDKWQASGGGKSVGGGRSPIKPAVLAAGAAERDRRLFHLAGEVAK
jgi:Glycoside hydrolase 123, catalytic domain/Glycoside hydrolase 123 N-terminal domain